MTSLEIDFENFSKSTGGDFRVPENSVIYVAIRDFESRGNKEVAFQLRGNPKIKY